MERRYETKVVAVIMIFSIGMALGHSIASVGGEMIENTSDSESCMSLLKIANETYHTSTYNNELLLNYTTSNYENQLTQCGGMVNEMVEVINSEYCPNISYGAQ